MQKIRNKRGQGMIEYLILVAVIAVGAMAVVKVVGENVSIQFANVAKALGSTNGTKIAAAEVTSSMHSRKDMSNFLNGAINKSHNQSDSDDQAQ